MKGMDVSEIEIEGDVEEEVVWESAEAHGDKRGVSVVENDDEGREQGEKRVTQGWVIFPRRRRLIVAQKQISK